MPASAFAIEIGELIPSGIFLLLALVLPFVFYHVGGGFLHRLQKHLPEWLCILTESYLKPLAWALRQTLFFAAVGLLPLVQKHATVAGFLGTLSTLLNIYFLALGAALLICATAIAAQLGLLSFWETNPYRLFHNRERVRPTLSVRPLDVTDASGLRLTEVSALDAAWIEGRLTLALRVAAKDGQPLTVGLTEEDGILLPDGQDASGPVLLEDGFACYTRSGGVDGWPDTGLSVACQPDGDGVLLALQLPADFITASDLPVLTDGDAISLRLEWTVYDPTQARVAIESALLTAPAPTEAEKEEMDP